MHKITLRDQLRYRFDNTMAKGTVALVAWLFLASAVLITLVGVLVSLSGIGPEADDGAPMGVGAALWFTLMRTLDAGTMGGDTGSVAFLGAMFFVTLGGIFLVSTLIGVLTSGIEGKLDELRKGRSLVCEREHTVILGWSAQIFPIVSELLLANASRPGAAIVILADKDKVEMEDELRAKVSTSGRTKIVCRTGSPIDPTDLALVNPNEARAIIVLSPEEGDPDSHVIKAILALTNGPDRREGRYHIVAEIRDERNMEAARLVARDEAQLLLVGDLIASITVQTCRQTGLSAVFTELLDFDGDEIYMRDEPSLAGKTFGEALSGYETSCLIGLRRKSGEVRLNPPMDSVIERGDRVIMVAQDDSSIRLSGKEDPRVEADAIREATATERAPERTLILGWNRRGPTILNQLERYVAPGSVVNVVADGEAAGVDIAEQCAALKNLEVLVEVGDTTNRRTLDRVTQEPHDHVITLSYSDTLGPQEADAKTLITLLHLRDIAGKSGHPFSIVSEMLDVRNRQLAEVTRADDFIVSDKLISLMLSQIAENRELSAVFADLFDPEGSELYLRPAGDYVELGRPLTFYTVLEAARRRGQVALGYRIAADAGLGSKFYGVRVNPDKSKAVTFEEGDRIIVLAEE